jgi:ABC-type transport system involved in Fe-S cluster assembly fused permease/ATPase subunit
VQTSGPQDAEERQNIGQSRDTGNIRNTRNRSQTNKAQQTICLVFLMFPVSLDFLLCFVCLISVSRVPAVSSVSRLSAVSISKSKDKAYYFETYKEFDNEKDFLEQYSP